MITSKDIPNFSLIKNPPRGNFELQDQDDYVYYNVKIYNENNIGAIEAKFKDRRLEPILENPSQYEVAIVRFNIPGTSIPIQIFKENFYLLTLRFDGTDESVYLNWTPNRIPPNNHVRNFWEFVDSTNTAFETVFNNLLSTFGTDLPVTEPPRMVYNSKTKLFELYVQPEYNPNIVSPTVEIWFNFNLHLIYSGLQTFDVSTDLDQQYQILIKDNFTNNVMVNGSPYILMESEFSTAFLLKDLLSIVIESNEIPVSRELLPGNQVVQVVNTSVSDVSRSILTDFEPLITNGIIEREQFQFFPLGPLRYVPLKSKFPLKSIDIYVSWSNNQGVLSPIKIEPNDALTIKLLFRKRRSIVFADELGQSESI